MKRGSVLLVCLAAAVQAGQDPVTLSGFERDLGQVRQEISGLRAKIEQLDRAEQSTVRSLTGLEEKIFYQRRLITTLDRSQRQLERNMRGAERRITDQQQELARRRELLTRRARHLYIHGRNREMEALLTSESVSQSVIRLRYLQYFIRRDREQMEAIKGLVRSLRQEKAGLEADLSAKQQLRREHEQEVRKLGRSQEDRKQRQVALRRDRRLAQEELKAKEASLNRILATVERLAREAAPSEERRPFVPDVPFETLRGRMIWPVRGPVLAGFGLNRNAALKTQTINPGVDIGTRTGADVLAVAQGRVAEVTWMPGFGVMLFLTHDKGYVTTYSPLGEIHVAMGQDVRGGSAIGRVGETGTGENPRLNFMIWKGNDKLDPLPWLQRTLSRGGDEASR